MYKIVKIQYGKQNNLGWFDITIEENGVYITVHIKIDLSTGLWSVPYYFSNTNPSVDVSSFISNFMKNIKDETSFDDIIKNYKYPTHDDFVIFGDEPEKSQIGEISKEDYESYNDIEKHLKENKK